MSLSQDCVHSPLLSLSAPHFVSHDDRGLCLPGASHRPGPPMSVMMVSGLSLSLSMSHHHHQPDLGPDTGPALPDPDPGDTLSHVTSLRRAAEVAPHYTLVTLTSRCWAAAPNYPHETLNHRILSSDLQISAAKEKTTATRATAAVIFRNRTDLNKALIAGMQI